MSISGYTVIEPRQTWRIIDGQHYREVVARRHADNQLRLLLVLDGAA